MTNLEACHQTLIALNLSQNMIRFTSPEVDGVPAQPGLGMLTNLVALDLSYNNISSLLGSGIRHLARLEELDLRFNQISQVDGLLEELASCKSLKMLKLNGNPIEQAMGPQALQMVLRRVLPQLQALDGASIVQGNFHMIEEGMSTNRSE